MKGKSGVSAFPGRGSQTGVSGGRPRPISTGKGSAGTLASPSKATKADGGK